MLPMLNPSHSLLNSSASMMMLGTSAMSHTLKSLLRFRPSSAMSFRHSSTSHVVLTKGSMTHTFFRPHSSLTFRIALHSRRKASLNCGLMYLLTPLQPSMGLSSWGSYSSPPFSWAYSFVLKSLNLTTTGLG